MLDSLLILIVGVFAGWFFNKKLKSIQESRIIIKEDEDYIKALNFIVDKNFQNAQKYLMNTIDRNPDNVMAYQRLGELKYNNGNYAKALKVFEMITMKGVITNDELILAYKGYAKCLEKLNKNDKAVEIWNKIIDISPKDEETVNGLINLHEKKREWENVLKLLKKKKDITDTINKPYLAYILSCKSEDINNKGNLKEAEKVAKEALDSDEGCIPALIVLGDVYYKNGEIKDAIAEWEKILIINPQLGFMVFNRLEKAYFENNEYERMTIIYDKVLKAVPSSGITHVSLGDLYFSMGNHNQALLEYKEGYNNGYLTKEMMKNIFKMFKEEKRLDEFFSEIESVFVKLENDYKYNCLSCNHSQKIFFWKCPNCEKLVYLK